MAEPTLGVSAGFAFVSAIIYVYVGVRFGRRQVSGESKMAARMFALFWLGLAATTASGGILSLTGALGDPNLGVVSAATYMNVVVISAALMGLLYYLVYLYTGRKEILMPLVALYSTLGVTLALYIASSNPTGVLVSRWSVGLTYARPLTGPFVLIVVGLLILPQLIAALVYFRLYFRLHDPTQRFRVAVVSWSLILWFGIGLLAGGAGLSRFDWWQVASRGLGLGAALAILTAYYPPRWVKDRFGLTTVLDQAVKGGHDP